jgi:hypothetical protein
MKIKKIGVKYMKLSKLFVVISSGFGLLLAYNNLTQARNLDSKKSSSFIVAEIHDNSKSQGGQVVESGIYHLELVTIKGANGTHLDFYLQRGDTHEAIPNAKVTAQVQSPDGKQKSLNLAYDAKGKHYAALFPGKTTGQYQVRVVADINGKKVNGRFSFK